MKGLNLQLGMHEVVGLIGPSGCGKSSLSKMLSGYLQPKEGEILFKGKPLPKSGYCPVQLIYQHPEKAVNPKWHMEQILHEGERIEPYVLERLGIKPEWMSRWPNELSGGELQRFCIARALGKQTEYIIADEMTTMLDAITQASIWNVLMDLVQERGLGMLVVTHNQALAERVCHRIVYFDEIAHV